MGGDIVDIGGSGVGWGVRGVGMGGRMDRGSGVGVTGGGRQRGAPWPLESSPSIRASNVETIEAWM